MFSKDGEAEEFLKRANIFYETDEDDEEDFKHTINMNDEWCWACAEGLKVPDDKMEEVAKLFWRYGWCGILYWASEQEGQRKSEFYDNNRFIEFVRNEEKLRKEMPNSSDRAYSKIIYTLGE